VRWPLVGNAAAVFAATNLDDLLILVILLAEAETSGRSRWRVVAGQYLGFIAILAVALLGAVGAGFLPARYHPWLGLLPIALGLRAGWLLLRRRGPTGPAVGVLPGVPSIALLTLASGGDNVGAYVPVLSGDGAAETAAYVAVFLACLGLWCLLGMALTAHHTVRAGLARWADVVLPVVLLGIGVTILLSG
jgi:cadmium resistance protein CadD (predicted permease)